MKITRKALIKLIDQARAHGDFVAEMVELPIGVVTFDIAADETTVMLTAHAALWHRLMQSWPYRVGPAETREGGYISCTWPVDGAEKRKPGRVNQNLVDVHARIPAELFVRLDERRSIEPVNAAIVRALTNMLTNDDI